MSYTSDGRFRTEDGSIVVIDAPEKRSFEVYEKDGGLEMFLGYVPYSKGSQVKDGPIRRAISKHERAKAEEDRKLRASVVRLASERPDLRVHLVPLLKEAAGKTYAEAQKAVMDYLQSEGWTVKTGLKVPYATSRDGRIRFWFKKQAVYFTTGDRHDLGNAVTLTYDTNAIKNESPEAWVKWAVERVKKDRMASEIRQGPSSWDEAFDKLPTKTIETLASVAFGKGWSARNDADGRKLIYLDPVKKKVTIHSGKSWSEAVRKAATAIGLTHAQFVSRMNQALSGGRRAAEVFPGKPRSPEEKAERRRQAQDFFEKVRDQLPAGEKEIAGTSLSFKSGKKWVVADLQIDAKKVVVRNRNDQKKKIGMDPKKVSDLMVEMLDPTYSDD